MLVATFIFQRVIQKLFLLADGQNLADDIPARRVSLIIDDEIRQRPKSLLQKEEIGEQHNILTLMEDPTIAYRYPFVACTPRVQLIVHRATQNFIRVLQDKFAALDLGAQLARAMRSTK